MSRDKYTMLDIIGVLQGINGMAEIKLPPRYAYALARMKRQVDPEIRLFEDRRAEKFEELKTAKVDKEGEPILDENGRPTFVVPKENLPEFQEWLDTELELEHPIEIIHLDVLQLEDDYMAATGEGLVLERAIMDLLFPVLDFYDGSPDSK